MHLWFSILLLAGGASIASAEVAPGRYSGELNDLRVVFELGADGKAHLEHITRDTHERVWEANATWKATKDGVEVTDPKGTYVGRVVDRVLTFPGEQGARIEVYPFAEGATPFAPSVTLAGKRRNVFPAPSVTVEVPAAGWLKGHDWDGWTYQESGGSGQVEIHYTWLPPSNITAAELAIDELDRRIGAPTDAATRRFTVRGKPGAKICRDTADSRGCVAVVRNGSAMVVVTSRTPALYGVQDSLVASLDIPSVTRDPAMEKRLVGCWRAQTSSSTRIRHSAGGVAVVSSDKRVELRADGTYTDGGRTLASGTVGTLESSGTHTGTWAVVDGHVVRREGIELYPIKLAADGKSWGAFVPCR